MSEMTEAAEKEAENLINDDPIRTIIEAEARSHRDAFKQLGQIAGEEDEDTPAASEEKQSATEKESQKSTSKRPGVDKVLKEVEDKIGKDAADVIRGLQTQMQGRRREREQTEKRLSELQERLDSLTKPATQPSNDPLAGLTPQQWEIFNEMARRAGLVNKQEIVERDASGFVQQEIRSGLEKHGERFGHLDDETGEFVPSEESEVEMRKVYERIYDTARGLTAKDLFVLAKHDAIVEELQGELERAKKEASSNRRAEKVETLKRANVERASTNGIPTRKPSVYKEGEPLENVIRRAFAEQLR